MFICTDSVSECDHSVEGRNVSASYIVCRKSSQFTLQFILSTELRWFQSVAQAQVNLSTMDLLMKILSQNEQKMTLMGDLQWLGGGGGSTYIEPYTVGFSEWSSLIRSLVHQLFISHAPTGYYFQDFEQIYTLDCT